MVESKRKNAVASLDRAESVAASASVAGKELRSQLGSGHGFSGSASSSSGVDIAEGNNEGSRVSEISSSSIINENSSIIDGCGASSSNRRRNNSLREELGLTPEKWLAMRDSMDVAIGSSSSYSSSWIREAIEEGMGHDGAGDGAGAGAGDGAGVGAGVDVVRGGTSSARDAVDRCVREQTKRAEGRAGGCGWRMQQHLVYVRTAFK
jgi:hypothetical protein